MNKFIVGFITLLILAGSAKASLYCASGDLSVDEIVGRASRPYKTMQVDEMNEYNIQVFITDYYGNSADETIPATWVKNEKDACASGIKLGTYTSKKGDITISQDGQKVHVFIPDPIPTDAKRTSPFTCGQE